jgi:hypothetical protein
MITVFEQPTSARSCPAFSTFMEAPARSAMARRYGQSAWASVRGLDGDAEPHRQQDPFGRRGQDAAKQAIGGGRSIGHDGCSGGADRSGCAGKDRQDVAAGAAPGRKLDQQPLDRAR